jgi:hypothetical protein
LNVGSGGGAAAAPTSGGATAGGDAAAAETKEEEKVEGKHFALQLGELVDAVLMTSQRRKSQTRIWASDFLTKYLPHLSCLYFPMHGHGFLPYGANWLVE